MKIICGFIGLLLFNPVSREQGEMLRQAQFRSGELSVLSHRDHRDLSDFFSMDSVFCVAMKKFYSPFSLLPSVLIKE
jgi:hypothetical protein